MSRQLMAMGGKKSVPMIGFGVVLVVGNGKQQLARARLPSKLIAKSRGRKQHQGKAGGGG
jgi:hypothetical protein